MQKEIRKLQDELASAYKHIEIISEPSAVTPSSVTIPKFASNVLSPEILSEKLQDSVKMLREAMVQNQDLRRTVEELEIVNNMIKADNA